METSNLPIHIQKEIQTTTQRYGAESPKLASLLSKIGTSFHYRREYSRALTFFYKSLEIRIISLGKDSLSVANSRQRIGVSLLKRSEEQDNSSNNDATKTTLNNNETNENDHDAVNQLYESLRIRILSRTSSSASIDMAEAYHYLGIALTRTRDFAGAISYLRTALDMRLTILGPRDALVSQTYYRMGVAYLQQGSTITLSIESLSKALAISREVSSLLGHNDCDESLGVILYALGKAYLVNKNYDEALQYCQEAFHIQEETFGSDSVTAANTLFTVGIIHCQRVDYNRAIDCFSKVARVRERNGDDRGVVAVLDVLGHTLYHQKQFAKALACYGKVYQLKKTLFENDESDDKILSSSVKETLMKLGRTYFQLSERDNAKICFLRAFKGNNNQAKSRGVIGLMNSVALHHLERGDISTAMEVLQEAAAERGRANGNAYSTASTAEGSDYPELIMTMTYMGRLRWDNQEYELAVLAFTEAKMIAIETLNTDEYVMGMERTVVDDIICLREGLVRDVQELRDEMTRRHEEEDEDSDRDQDLDDNTQELYTNESYQRTNTSTTLLNSNGEETTNSTSRASQGSRNSTVTNITSGTHTWSNYQGTNNELAHPTLIQGGRKGKFKEDMNDDTVFSSNKKRRELISFIVAIQDMLEVSTGTHSSYCSFESFDGNDVIPITGSRSTEILLLLSRLLMCSGQYSRPSLPRQKSKNCDVVNGNDCFCRNNDNGCCCDVDDGYFSLKAFVGKLRAHFLDANTDTTPPQILQELFALDDALFLNNEIMTSKSAKTMTSLEGLKIEMLQLFQQLSPQMIHCQCNEFLQAADGQQDTNENILSTINILQDCTENNNWWDNISVILNALVVTIVSLSTRNDGTAPSMNDSSSMSFLHKMKLRDVMYNIISLSLIFLGHFIPEHHCQCDDTGAQQGHVYPCFVEDSMGQSCIDCAIFDRKMKNGEEKTRTTLSCFFNHVCPWLNQSAPPVIICSDQCCRNNKKGQDQEQDNPKHGFYKECQNKNSDYIDNGDGGSLFPANKINNHNSEIPSSVTSTPSKNNHHVTIVSPPSSKKRDSIAQKCHFTFQRKISNEAPRSNISLPHYNSLFRALVLVTILMGVVASDHGDGNTNWCESSKNSSSNINGARFRSNNECPYLERGLVPLLYSLSKADATAREMKLCDLSDCRVIIPTCRRSHGNKFDPWDNHHAGNRDTTNNLLDTAFPLNGEMSLSQELTDDGIVTMAAIFNEMTEAPCINESPYFCCNARPMSYSNETPHQHVSNFDNAPVQNDKFALLAKAQPQAPKQRRRSIDDNTVPDKIGKPNVTVNFTPLSRNTTIPAKINEPPSPTISTLKLFLRLLKQLSASSLIENNNNNGSVTIWAVFQNQRIVLFLVCDEPNVNLIRHASCA